MLIDFTYRDIDRQEGAAAPAVALTKDDKMDLKYYRLENLIQRRAFLLSNVVLR